MKKVALKTLDILLTSVLIVAVIKFIIFLLTLNNFSAL